MTTTIYTTGQIVPSTLTINAGDTVIFRGTASAGATQITNAGTVRFEDQSSAGTATITTSSGGKTLFVGNSTAGGAALVAASGGIVDFSGTTGALGDHRISAGSISGAGKFYLGADEVTVGANNASTTVSGVIADGGQPGGVGSTGGSLVKIGTGTLTLSGGNTVVGGITVTAGKLTVASDASLGAASNVLTLDGGTLSAPTTGSTLTLNHAIVLGADGGTLGDGTRRFAIAGEISGIGELTVATRGIVTLLGTNTYTGGTTITSGTLAVGSHDTNALRSTGFGEAVATISGPIVNNAGLVILNANLTGVTSLSTTTGATTEFYQAVPAGLALTTAAGAAVNLFARQNGEPLTETTDFEGSGTYTLENNVTAVIGNPSGGAPISATFLGGDGAALGGELVKQGTDTVVFAGGSIGADLTIQSGRVQFGTTLEGTLSGTPDGFESATRLVDNFAQLDIVNSTNPGGYFFGLSGALTTENGARTDFYNRSDASGTVVNVLAGGVVDFSRSSGPMNDGVVRVAALAGGGTVDLGANQLEFVRLTGGYTFSGSLNDGGAAGGTGASVHIDAGADQALTGSSTYSGGTFIDGTLRVASDAALGAAAGALTFNGGTLYTTSNLSPARSVTLDAGGGTLNFGDTGSFVISDISGVGHLTKEGAATVILETTSYTGGTTNAAGTMQVGTTASGATSGPGGTTGTLAGAVVNGGRLDIVNADTSALTSLTEAGDSGAMTTFYNGTSAGAATFTIGTEAVVNFRDQSSAANATFRTDNAAINFYDQSTAANAAFSTSEYGYRELVRYSFFDHSTAGSADLDIRGQVQLVFSDDSSAGSSNITTYSFAPSIVFEGNSTAANSTINMLTGYRDRPSEFRDQSSGGNANVTLGAQAYLTFSGSGPNGDNTNSLGSLSIDRLGFLDLGSTALSVGSNDLSTTVAGTITGSGSIVKVGAGTLTMAGSANYYGNAVYSGGTTIRDGTVDLASSGGIGAGAVTFSGSFGHFATFAIEASQQPANGATFSNVLRDFDHYDALDLRGLAWTASATATYDAASHLLSVNSGGRTENFTLSGTVAPQYFAHSDGHGGTVVTNDHTPCYCTGTLILTDRGEVPVEALSVGDQVVTASGERRAIRWIGHRRTQIARHPQPERVRPVRILAGAIAPGVPSRDLRVSPGHAVAVDGVLVKAGRLVNGASILRESIASVTYWHVELDSHDLLVADGMPAESYVACNNRSAFENGGAVVQMHPEFEGLDAHAAQTCLPLVDGGEALEAIRTRLLAAVADRFSADAGLALLADGVALTPVSVEGQRYRFAVPEGTVSLRLVSRSGIASEILSGSGDHRRLGLAIRNLTVDGATTADEALGEGWHARAPGRDHRWTDGDAALPLGLTVGFEATALARYPVVQANLRKAEAA